MDCTFVERCLLVSYRSVSQGVGVVLLSVTHLLESWFHLDSLVHIGYVAPGL
jgi:hypothetical protein